MYQLLADFFLVSDYLRNITKLEKELNENNTKSFS